MAELRTEQLLADQGRNSTTKAWLCIKFMFQKYMDVHLRNSQEIVKDIAQIRTS